jgi:2',3'-cyclic-nucleotide 2'-phosphodiesterase (5'-nucleotidase family)
MVEAVVALRYDALVPGNHDFDLGLDNLRRLTAAAGIPVLAANLRSASYRTDVLPHQAPFLVREVEGARVFILGLTNPLTPRWLLPRPRAAVRAVDGHPGAAPCAGSARRPVLAVHQGYRH